MLGPRVFLTPFQSLQSPSASVCTAHHLPPGTLHPEAPQMSQWACERGVSVKLWVPGWTLFRYRSLMALAICFISQRWSASRFLSFSFSARVSSSVSAICKGSRSGWPLAVFFSMSCRQQGEGGGQQSMLPPKVRVTAMTSITATTRVRGQGHSHGLGQGHGHSQGHGHG